ncbi:Mus7/MMS22 family-domain-containing protein [Stachybotrys elegans]|uniref:Mus7/MMS22 family-domain-containing protein n=1 Tax=Stachybotrys elegans TaxID=80388 RepID=A0A8K0WPE0_9HYPO|nr:Mus7/MMS22 family-domain-containing protein [Stachybotrys elegans]
MPNWKDLGEIPDSEDEDGTFESQNVDPANANERDIWDFPDSQEDAILRPSLPKLHDNPTSTPSRTVISSIFDSSPLSSPPSEHDLPPVQQLVLGRRLTERLSNPTTLRTTETLESAGETPVSQSAASPIVPTAESADPARQPTHTVPEGRTSEQDPRQVAIRYERSLRPRKPIQEHPYLLENAAYSNLFKSHGVKPVRMAVNNQPNREKDNSQDEEFQEESQQSLAAHDTEESQLDGPEHFNADHDSTLMPSSPFIPPPLDPAPTTTPGPTPGPKQLDRASNDNLADQDLPDLDELLTLPPRFVRTQVTKRPSSPPSTLRKRRRRNVVESDPPEAADNIPGTTQRQDSPDPLNDSPLPYPPLSPIRDESLPALPAPQPLSAERKPSEPLEIYRIDDDSEDTLSGKEEGGQSNDETLTPSSPAESDSELVTTVGRRIRGVLPASWLRLDQKSVREKVQQDFSRRRPPDQEQRRGIAQRRQAAPGSRTEDILFEESEDEAPQVRQIPRPDSPVQSRLVLQPIPSTEPGHLDLSDDESVIEEDFVDPMAAGSTRKRQLKLAESFSGARKRPKISQKPSSTQPPNKMRQPRIDSHLFGTSRSQGIAKTKTPTTSRAVQKQKHRPATKVQKPKRRTRKSAPPRLSILDVIDSEAPQFLRIAARTVKQRRDQGRADLAKKNIQLATRQDHLDTMAVMSDWRSGSIKQRPSVSAAIKKPATRRRTTQPLSEVSRNILPKPPAAPREPARKLVKKTSAGGSISFMQKAGTKSTSKPNARRDETPDRLVYPAFLRPAQLETDETNVIGAIGFQSGKRFLDRLYRNKHQNSLYAGSTVSSDADTTILPRTLSRSKTLVDKPRTGGEDKRIPAPTRVRKNPNPKRLDIDAPEYAHANDPVPLTSQPRAGIPDVQQEGGKLLGLGPYGTQYTLHFDIFPLDSRVYFHQSTLLGSGVMDTLIAMSQERVMSQRPRVAFNLGEKTLRWDNWNDQVSSELGIVLDFITEKAEGAPGLEDPPVATVVTPASDFVLRYVKDSMWFSEESHIKMFITRVHECLQNMDDRLKARLAQCTTEQQRSTCEPMSLVYDRLILVVFAVFQLCQSCPTLMGEQFLVEELLKRVIKTQCTMLTKLGLDYVRQTYKRLGDGRFCELGLRNDEPLIHSWVIALRVLERARIPRSSFWDMAHQALVNPDLSTTLDAGELERVWENMFILLPLVEFNDVGVIVSSRRNDVTTDGWSLVQKLLKRVFQLYTENRRQSPSFNNYCRALLSRCHLLVQQWGWKKSATIVGVIFDFFGSQNLAHLRNEEVHKSPRFLEELAQGPRLNIEPEDKCFHVFLKLVALSIQKLKDVGSVKDVRNLVARIMPNHNRQYLKEQQIHERDLAALRNHHDLLCTLFWASPKDIRPAVALIEDLVIPASSHKEACLINLRAWKQLAQFIVANGEAAASFRAFGQWRDAFFQQMLRQFDSVASDIQQQFLSLSKDVVQTISQDMVSSMVALNKKAVLDVLRFSITSSLQVLRCTPDLEAATVALNTNQLQQVFRHFSSAPPEFDWEILRESLATVNLVLSKMDELQDEESQQSESQILSSTQADGAILILDRAISQPFFSMARCILSPRGELSSSLSATTSKHHCVETIIRTAATLSAKLLTRGIMRVGDCFKPGKYGVFDGLGQRNSPDMRRAIVLFVTILLKNGVEDFSDTGFSLLDLWMVSIVKHHSSLQYEYQLAEQLSRHHKFVPETIIGLSVQPDYSGNRDLFEYAIAHMRKQIRDAGPSTKRNLMSDHAKALKLAMEQMKMDLKAAAGNTHDHQRYVVFVRDIISLIRAHGSDFCTIDDFFYQITKEYSPSAQDPQLQVAGMVSYGLRLGEGDSRAAQQLFFFLFNNAKSSIINDTMGDEAEMMRKGMEDANILRFVLDEMLPAIIQAVVLQRSAFPLLDIYVEALRRLLSESVCALELGEDVLPQVSVTLHALASALDLIDQRPVEGTNQELTMNTWHIIKRLTEVANIISPSVYLLGLTGSEAGDLVTAKTWLGFMREWINRRLDTDNFARPLGQGTGSAIASMMLTPRVAGFVENITNDIRRNWVMTEERITIQAPGRARGTPSTQSGQGVLRPRWTASELRKDLSERALVLGDCYHHETAPCATSTMGSLFQLPDEVIITPLLQAFPGRERQIRSLASLVHPDAIPCRNIVLHGTEATGKSSIAEALLQRLGRHLAEEPQAGGGLQYAIVNSAQCITARHLFERTAGAVADALQWDEAPRRCETVAQLTVELTKMLKYPTRDPRWRFVLVLDAIDKQRDAPATLLPALARLSEIIPCLTCVFVVTTPPASFLRTPASAHVHFLPYTKPEFVQIMALAPPPPIDGTTQQETADLWARFCAAVHDALIRSASRTLLSFRHSCHALWPRFTAPILAGTHTVKEFSKLLIVARVHFQDESLLNPSIVSVRPAQAQAPAPTKPSSASLAELTALLPTIARLLLMAAYLASHNASRHDLTLFSTYHHGRKRRRGGGFAASRTTGRSKHRKIARKLLGAHAFVMERMMAIFEAVRSEWVDNGSVGAAGLDSDVGMAIATLASLRLLIRVGGGGDVMDRGGKWRINVGWEVIRGIGRSIGVEVEEWLIE